MLWKYLSLCVLPKGPSALLEPLAKAPACEEWEKDSWQLLLGSQWWGSVLVNNHSGCPQITRELLTLLGTLFFPSHVKKIEQKLDTNCVTWLTAFTELLLLKAHWVTKKWIYFNKISKAIKAWDCFGLVDKQSWEQHHKILEKVTQSIYANNFQLQPHLI